MTMRISRAVDGELFASAGHSGVAPVHLQGGPATPTEGFTVVLSHYLPGGEAAPAPQPAETVYVVTAGELVFLSEGDEVTLGPMDSAHFAAGTVRSVENRSLLPASMIVIRMKA